MDNFSEAAAVVRTRDRDRYVADLFAPEPARKHLFALHAFGAEIARIPSLVSDPTLGEIRLQWWRDALAGGDGSGHPVAAAVIETMRTFALPAAALDMMIEARIFDLYDDPLRTLADLEAYAGETESALTQLAAIVLAGGRDPGSADAAGHGGVGETLVSILHRLSVAPAGAAKYVPDALLDSHGVRRATLTARTVDARVVGLFGELRALARGYLAQATAVAAGLDPAVTPAFLPLAVAEARLGRMERNAARPFASAELAPWRRQWITWRAARRAARRP
jgi:phytoene synthase